MIEIPTGGRNNRSIPVLFELPKEHPDWQHCKAWWMPTIYQVLKWLREEKNTVVSMYPYYGKYVEVHWNWDVRIPVYRVVINSDVKQGGFDSYEQAAQRE